MSVKRIPRLKQHTHTSGGSGYNWTNGYIFSSELPTSRKNKDVDALGFKRKSKNSKRLR